MIINLWSTPRTGSVWYSFKLLLEYKKKNPNTILLTEPFNKWHMNIYRKIENGIIKNFHEYAEGLYYDDYQLDENGCVVVEKKFEPRVRTVDEEEEYRKDLLSRYNKSVCTLILHNHTSPLPEGIYETLKWNGARNIFIGRRDFVQQLSSYAVAIATKRFAKFRDIEDPVVENLTAPEEPLRGLVERILHWESLDKSWCEVLYYEDIDFTLDNPENVPVPHKQNVTSSFDKLSRETQQYILGLEANYYERHHQTESSI